MKLIIAEPQTTELAGFTSEVATETRARLNEWLALVPEDAPAKAELSAESKKLAKEQGRAAYNEHTGAIEGGLPAYDHFTLTKTQGQFVMAALVVQLKMKGWEQASNKEFISYVLEGCANAMSAHMHKLGVSPEDKEQAQPIIAGISMAPNNTSAKFDDYARDVMQLLGHGYKYLRWGEHNDYGLENLSYETFYFGNWRGADYTLYCNSRSNGAHEYYHGRSLMRADGILYVQDGVAWFAGYATAKDTVNRRFTRQRAAAVVKHCTGSDVQAAVAVDTIRAGTSACTSIVIHPNDVPFGTVYIQHREQLPSCMAHGRHNYNTWDSIHPVDVYSSAYFGAGDNGLALITCFTNELATSRAILNTRTNKVVRWYGSHRDMLYVTGAFGIKDSSNALNGSWLALVQDGSKFIAPYVDGNYDHGSIDTESKRVLLTDCDGFCLTDTDGVYYDMETRMCCLDGAEYPIDELEYQEDTETYYNPENTHLGVREWYNNEWVRESETFSAEYQGDTVYFRDGDEVPDDWVFIEHRNEYWDTCYTVVDFNGNIQHEGDVVNNKAGEFVLECDYDEEEDVSDDEDERECA